MITRIREVRRARGITLEDVAQRCDPPTTAQTIGRLETGTRTVSVGWLNRIAKALGVDAQDLVETGASAELKVAAVLGPGGAVAPKRAAILVSPRVEAGQIAVLVGASIGDYRSGDEIWCDTLAAEDYGRALNRDVLIPRPAARFIFGRLINRDEEKLPDPPARCRRPPAGRRQSPMAGIGRKAGAKPLRVFPNSTRLQVPIKLRAVSVSTAPKLSPRMECLASSAFLLWRSQPSWSPAPRGLRRKPRLAPARSTPFTRDIMHPCGSQVESRRRVLTRFHRFSGALSWTASPTAPPWRSRSSRRLPPSAPIRPLRCRWTASSLLSGFATCGFSNVGCPASNMPTTGRPRGEKASPISCRALPSPDNFS